VANGDGSCNADDLIARYKGRRIRCNSLEDAAKLTKANEFLFRHNGHSGQELLFLAAVLRKYGEYDDAYRLNYFAITRQRSEIRVLRKTPREGERNEEN
jgi:hypothetical protein